MTLPTTFKFQTARTPKSVPRGSLKPIKYVGKQMSSIDSSLEGEQPVMSKVNINLVTVGHRNANVAKENLNASTYDSPPKMSSKFQGGIEKPPKSKTEGRGTPAQMKTKLKS